MNILFGTIILVICGIALILWLIAMISIVKKWGKKGEAQKELEEANRKIIEERNSKLAINQSSTNVGMGCVIFFFVIVGIVWIIFTYFYAPSHTTQNLPTTRQIAVVKLAIAIELPYAETRLEYLEGSNLNIYIKRSDFESIPFPDRAEAATRIGIAWCDIVDKVYLPSVKIRDIRTGEQLAKYSCVGGGVSISEDR
jgi:hypothetical protein